MKHVLPLLLCVWASAARADPECTLAHAQSMDEIRRRPHVLVFHSSESCPPCRVLLPVVRDFACAHHITGAVLVVDGPWYEEPAGLPELQALRKGVVVDRQCGAVHPMNPGGDEANRQAVEHFLIRNGFIQGSLAQLETKMPKARTGSTNQDITNGCLGPGRFDGTDWSGLWARDAVISGVSFRHAKLRNAVFRGAFLTWVDFTGADLASTNFEDARAVHVTCPDGRFIADGPFTCAKR